MYNPVALDLLQWANFSHFDTVSLDFLRWGHCNFYTVQLGLLQWGHFQQHYTEQQDLLQWGHFDFDTVQLDFLQWGQLYRVTNVALCDNFEPGVVPPRIFHWTFSFASILYSQLEAQQAQFDFH